MACVHVQGTCIGGEPQQIWDTRRILSWEERVLVTAVLGLMTGAARGLVLYISDSAFRTPTITPTLARLPRPTSQGNLSVQGHARAPLSCGLPGLAILIVMGAVRRQTP